MNGLLSKSHTRRVSSETDTDLVDTEQDTDSKIAHRAGPEATETCLYIFAILP